MRSTPLPDNTGAATPDAFGPFRVLHQTGSGALGPVFRAYDPEQDRLVAVKVFALGLQPEQAQALVARLQDLVDLDLAHPAVAAPVAAGLINGSAYLAQDFAAADSLEAIMREFGAASPADAARVAWQVAGALDSAAALGVYHGALHPRDLLLTADDTRVTGFGVAQALDVIGFAAPVRSPYCAPERVSGGAWDRRADVYSLAILVAEILTGRAPAGLVELDDLLDGTAAGLGVFGGVLGKAMAERPEDRYETAQAFADAFKAVAERQRADVVAPAASVEGRSPVHSLRSSPPPIAPRLPLDEPLRVTSVAAEARLPGDAPAAAEDPEQWETPLMAFSDSEDEPAEPVARPASGVRARRGLEWEMPTTNRLTVADGDAEVVTHDEASPVRSERWERSGAHRAGEASLSTATTGVSDLLLAPPAPLGPAPAAAMPAPSSVWPIPLAWMVGLIMGIAVGFFIFGSRDGGRQETATVPSAETAIAAVASPASGEPAPAPTTPRPSTESRVASPTATSGSAPEPAPARDAPESSPGGAAAATVSEDRRPASPGAPERPQAAAPGGSATSAAAAPTAPKRPAVNGRLLVRSSPAGARVQVDGKVVGSTPLTLRALALGPHTVRVTRTGYAPEERRVTVSASQPAQSLSVDLALARDRGATNVGGESSGVRPPTTGTPAEMIVESRPAGATVYIDGRRVGTTPATIDNVRVGQHTVFLELDGFRGWSRLVQLASGETHRVSASLEQQP